MLALTMGMDELQDRRRAVRQSRTYRATRGALFVGLAERQRPALGRRLQVHRATIALGTRVVIPGLIPVTFREIRS